MRIMNKISWKSVYCFKDDNVRIGIMPLYNFNYEFFNRFNMDKVSMKSYYLMDEDDKYVTWWFR